MIRKRLRSRCVQAAVVVILSLVLTGCFFNLREKEDFKNWYYGDPGLAGALGEAECDRYADNIEGQRHPYFLHFRTPEILLQPQGGAHYPARQTAESRAGGIKSNEPRCEKVVKGWETFRFDAVDAGWVDTLIPYRKSSTVNDRDRGMGEHSLAYAEGLLYNTGMTAVMKAPVYIVHDILKTLYIPVAGTYYLFKPDEPPPATEIIQTKADAPSEDISTDADGSGAMVAAETAPEEPPATVADETPLAADDVDQAHAPSDEARSVALARTEPGEETPETPSTEDAVESPDGSPAEPLADTDTATHAAGAAGADADRAVVGSPPVEGDAEPEPMADASAADSLPETDADEPQAPAPDGPPPGEDPDANRSEGMPTAGEDTAPETAALVAAAEEPAASPVADDPQAVDAEPAPMADAFAEEPAPPTDVGELPAPAPDGPPTGEDAGANRSEGKPAAAAETAPAPGTRITEQDEPPVPSEAAPAEATPSDDAARTASDAPPPTEARREADPPPPAEADQAPLTTDEAASPEPLSPADADVPEIQAPPGEEAPAPAPQVADEVPAAPPAGDTDQTAETERDDRKLPDETAGQTLSATSGDAGDADETGAPTAPPEDASSPADRPVEPRAEEDRVSEAVTSLTGVAKGAAPATDDGAPMPSAPSVPDGEIQEEDLLSGPSEEDVTAAAVPTEDAEAPSMTEEEPLQGAEAPPDPVASVTSDQRAAPPQELSPLAPIDRVRVSKKALQKKVAFIGFFSRAVNIDAETKAGLQAYLWPALLDECDDDLAILRRGDAGYPDTLDSLVRDPFGRMNSFELVTLARFSGLNAVVAGTIIDIRTANALSGILWYKSPQGQLRVTIMVEVFDAETGTKLFDHTYIREEEVNELEPDADADGRMRPEDLPVLEAALQSVALEMGEDICDALEDLPWRAFVSGIDGSRVTLSAGQEAGLKPGNILGVFNSQIIDGLNNQQFFLTGEKVGRIQVIHVYPDRSEALLIEGQGVRDYSVVMPD